jgi:hypothetical protein
MLFHGKGEGKEEENGSFILRRGEGGYDRCAYTRQVRGPSFKEHLQMVHCLSFCLFLACCLVTGTFLACFVRPGGVIASGDRSLDGWEVRSRDLTSQRDDEHESSGMGSPWDHVLGPSANLQPIRTTRVSYWAGASTQCRMPF